jgi:hypothetical protein
MRNKLALALVLIGLNGPAHAQTYVSVGYGGVGCASWVARKPIEGKAYEAWIYGYISSYNAYVFKGPNVIDGITDKQIRSWFDSFCKKSPEANLDSAVRSLIEEQIKKQAG